MYRNSHALPALSAGFDFASNGIVASLMATYSRALQRRRLSTMDDRMLADIGVSRAEATAEARKPFWRA